MKRAKCGKKKPVGPKKERTERKEKRRRRRKGREEKGKELKRKRKRRKKKEKTETKWKKEKTKKKVKKKVGSFSSFLSAHCVAPTSLGPVSLSLFRPFFLAPNVS